MPRGKHCTAEALDNPIYAPLDGLSRCLHFNALDQSYKKKMLVPHKLKSDVVDTSGVGKILWFGASKDTSEHNKYGNVSFTISMKELIQKFGSRFYYIDSTEYRTLTITRLLLSDIDHDQLEEVDLSEHGSPLKRSRWRHVVSCDSEHSSVQPHQIEIAIEVDKDDCRWLYEECDIEAVSHYDANITKGNSNKYIDHVCHKFNNFGKNCPYDYTEDECNDILKEEYPNLFPDSDEDDESDEDSEYNGYYCDESDENEYQVHHPDDDYDDYPY